MIVQWCVGCGQPAADCSCPSEPRPARPEGWRITEFGEALVHSTLAFARDRGELDEATGEWVSVMIVALVVHWSSTSDPALTDDEREWLDTLVAEYIAGDDRLY